MLNHAGRYGVVICLLTACSSNDGVRLSETAHILPAGLPPKSGAETHRVNLDHEDDGFVNDVIHHLDGGIMHVKQLF